MPNRCHFGLCLLYFVNEDSSCNSISSLHWNSLFFGIFLFLGTKRGEVSFACSCLCFCWWFLLVGCRKFKVTDLCIIDCSILCNWRGILFGSFGSSGRHFLAFNLNMPMIKHMPFEYFNRD